MKCPICSKDVKKKVNDLFHCTECSLTFSKERTQPEYYNDCQTYDPGIYTTFDNHISIVETIEPFLTKKMNVLDIGCSDGAVLLELRERGYKNLTAHDINTECLKYLRSRGINTIQKKEKYDFIILSHIIEHIDDLKLFIEMVEGLSHSKTLIYVETPNRQQYCNFPKHIYSNREHINNFDLFSIRRLFNKWSVIDYREKLAHKGTYAAIYCILSKESTEGNYEEKYNTKIKEMLKKVGKDFIAWGAGEFGLQVIQRFKPKLSLLVDTYKTGEICYFHIHHPMSILFHQKKTLCVFSTAKQNEIEHMARKIGFKGKIVKF